MNKNINNFKYPIKIFLFILSFIIVSYNPSFGNNFYSNKFSINPMKNLQNNLNSQINIYYFSISNSYSLNYFILDNSNRLHLEINKGEIPFIILASDFQNSGIYFQSDHIKKLEISNLSVLKENNHYLLTLELKNNNSNDKEFNFIVILDSIRAIRDFRGAHLANILPVYTYFKRQLEFFKIFDIYSNFDNQLFYNHLFNSSSKTLIINRKDIMGNEFEFSIYPVKLKLSKAYIIYSVKPSNKIIKIKFKIPLNKNISSNYIKGYEKFLNINAKSFFDKILKDKDNPNQILIRKSLYAMDFLITNEKMLAGSWRYLTYFGRDTIITTVLLNDISNSYLYKIAVDSVLNRMDNNGDVAHEEDLGFQAQYDHLIKILGTPNKIENINTLNTPVYDYKMKDDDFMFSILLNKYFLKLKEEKKEKEIKEFLGNNMFLSKTVANMEYVLNKVQECLYKDEPIKVDENHLVGDWRDSPEGLGYGIYPNSINLGLVVASLYSIKQNIYTFKSIYPNFYEYIKDKKYNIMKYIDNPELIDDLILKWKIQIYPKFKVHISSEELRRKLLKYLSVFNEKEREFYLNQKINPNFTIRDFINGKTDIELDFYALSLDKNMKPIEVINSDIGFMLFFKTIDNNDLSGNLKILDLPYPIGLKTDIGILTANPVLVKDLYPVLTKDSYHGTNIWAFQNYMITLGLQNYINNKYCFNLYNNLTNIIISNSDFYLKELFSYEIKNNKMVCKDFGSAYSKTESNIIQLWSLSLLSIFYNYYTQYPNKK